MARTASERQRRSLTAELRAQGALRSARVEAAFHAVAREHFLPETLAGGGLEAVYRDEAIVTKRGAQGLPLSSSSQPAIMAKMLELLDVQPGDRVLEIGAGTGYNAALLAHLTGPVTRACDPLGAGAVALQLTLAGWAVLELGLRVRERLSGRGGAARDRGTRALIAVTLGAAIAFAVVTGSRSTGQRIACPYRAVALIVMWLGLAIRVWAIAALGHAFRTTVEVDSEQAVVSTGPYRWVSHPSYSGLLLIATGCGLAAGNWLALAICGVLPLPALLWRIHVEEAELTLVLGDRYRAYQAQTKRLIPGLW